MNKGDNMNIDDIIDIEIEMLDRKKQKHLYKIKTNIIIGVLKC